MNEKPEIKQVSSFGSQGTQIGIQNNNFGITPNDAMQMALQMFREYYPQLKNDVLEEIQQTVIEKLKDVPPENIISPNPRIAFPTIQNACITPEKEIRELYEELLANSMNSAVKDGVHPGFVEIIKQLSPDEAKILLYMKKFPHIPIITLQYIKKGGGQITYIKNFSNVGEIMKCEKPFDISSYFDNLCRLGLLQNSNGLTWFNNEELYKPLINHPYIVDHSHDQRLIILGYESTKIDKACIELTDYGNKFSRTCIESKPIYVNDRVAILNDATVFP